jgi:hypothetical protein
MLSTLMMEIEEIFEMLVFNSILTWLMAGEDLSAACDSTPVFR